MPVRPEAATGERFRSKLNKFFQKIVVGGIVVALVGGGLYAWRARNNHGPSFRTVAVEKGDVVQKVLATGTVNPVTLVQVGSQVSGTIVNLYADFNSKVKKGQVVAQIDPALFAAAVAKAEGDYRSALANVAKQEAAVANTTLTLARTKAVRKQDLVAQSDVDDAQMRADQAKADLAAARASVGQTRASLQLAETNLRYSTIRSPVDGIVVARNVDVGQTVAASFQAPVLFTIAADLAKMQVDTNVDEADVGKVRVAQPAAFTVDAYPGEEFQGRVGQVRNSPQQVQNVITYDVVITVPNPELKLKPGMTANVAITTATEKGVLKVPNSSLRFVPRLDSDKAARPATSASQDQQQRVWVVGPGGKPQPVSVNVGISDGLSTEVVSGLSQGQKVIVEQIDQSGGKPAGMAPTRPF
jgi:HlyD family secretion protein